MKLRSVFFGLLLVACVATPLRAQYLAQPAVSADCGTAQTCTAKLAINVTAGNSLIAVIRLTAITSLSGTTITDTRSNSWVLDSWILQSTNLHILAVYRVASANAGATSLTVSNSATSTTRIVGLAEISGLASGAPSAQVSAVGSGTVAMPGTIATTQANEYVLLAAATDNNQSYTSLQPFLVEADVTRGAYADAIPTQPATLTPEISYSVSDDWLAIALAYKTTGTPRLPIFLTLHYDDGTPVTGNVVLYSLVERHQNFAAILDHRFQRTSFNLLPDRQLRLLRIRLPGSQRQPAAKLHDHARRLHLADYASAQPPIHHHAKQIHPQHHHSRQLRVSVGFSIRLARELAIRESLACERP